jgi:raffinose/stachyose/melibiose transport system permease protein
MRLHRKIDPLLFLALPLAAYVAVVLLPIISAVYYSFVKWNGISKITFVGLNNFRNMIKDPNLGKVLLNTLLYSATATVFQVGGGLLLAIMVTRVNKGVNLLRVLLFTPVVISSMAMSQTFKKLLSINPDGVVNALLGAFGLAHLKMAFLADMHITLYVLAIIESLRFSGLYMVIFYAAFLSIDKEVLEASAIDGALKWKMLLHIQLPMINAVIVNSLVLAVVGTLKAFDGPYIITNGGPGYATELISIYMYKRAFNMMDYGYGSALAILMIVLCIVVYRIMDSLIREKE